MDMRGSEDFRALERRALRWIAILEQGFLVLRSLAYLALLFWAGKGGIGSWVFLGMLLGDLLSWGLLALRRLGAENSAPWLEVLAYATLILLWQRFGDGFRLPEGGEGRAVVGLVFMFVFAWRLLLGFLEDRIG